MNGQDQLQWEARLARPAGAAAFAAGVLVLAGELIFQSILKDRKGVESLADFLLSVHSSPGTLTASRIIQALAALCLLFVFYYLFRVVVVRDERVPRWFVWLVFIGPVFYAFGQIVGAFDLIDRAKDFAGGTPIRGSAGGDRARDIYRGDPNALVSGFGLAGTVALAFMFVMLPLRARRVGLMSPIMGVLGIVIGVLLVLPLFPLVPVVIQAFWLGALGVLFLNRWPGGRGPAWETGEATPWPSATGRRGLLAGAGAGARAGGGAPAEEPAAEPEPVPERPSSRKRKRRKR